MSHRVRMLGASLGVLGIAAVAIGTIAEDAVATNPEQAIAYLNQQRAAYGIPPVTLDQSLLRPECNLGNHEIASPLTTWSSTVSPWGEAPFHEETLYSPSDLQASYGEYDHFGQDMEPWSCMWFHHEYNGTPSFYWAAEASGPAAVPPVVNASEWPSTPAEHVGLSNPTGPNIIVYAANMKGYPAAISATVVSQTGAAVSTHLAYDQSGSAVLVVDHPAESRTRYDVTVLWRGWEYAGPETGEVPVDYTQWFSFTTGFVPKELTPLLKVTSGGRVGKRARAWIKSDESLRGREVEVSVATLQRRCGRQRRPPRPGCGWGTSHRQVRTTVLSTAKVPIYVPRPTRRRKLHVRVTSKQFRFEEGVVKGANANLELRWSRKHRR